MCGRTIRGASTSWLLLSVMIVAVVVSMAGCGGTRASRATGAGQELFRAPHPTFTPTAPAPAGASVAQQDPAGAAAPAGSAQNPGSAGSALETNEAPLAVVNAPLVNLRAGPGTDTEIVATVARGSEYDILARSGDAEWWQVCCNDDEVVWVASAYADTIGSVDEVPVSDGTVAATAPIAPADVPPSDVPPSDGSVGDTEPSTFQLVAKERFAETNLVRIYLYVYDGTSALAGYKLRIEKDGREIPVSAQSFAGQPAFTWPFQDARQRYQNLKIELPGEPPAGTWRVQLVDPQGNAVGPPAEFTLRDNDPQRELYVRYERGE